MGFLVGIMVKLFIYFVLNDQFYQINMRQEDDADQETDGPGFKCPNCHQQFKHKRSLSKHLNNNSCKHIPGPEILDTPRRAPKASPVKVKVDLEVDGLLATINSPYVTWRLAQRLGVTQQFTYPILFNYRFPGSKTSGLCSICPTRDPYDVLCNVLIDARSSRQVNQIAMNKNVVIVDTDGSEVDVSKWLRPLNDREERSNRPKIVIEETESDLLFSSADVAHAPDNRQADLKESLHSMSLVE
jgi:hypothetical protein